VHVSDNLNGAWTRAAGETYSGTTGDVALYYVAGAKAGSTTVTVSADQATYLQATASEYFGVRTTAPLVATALATGSGTTAGTTATVAVPAGDLVYGAVQTGQGPGALSPGMSEGLPFILRTHLPNGTDGSEDILSGASGPQQASMTFVKSTNWYMVAAVFAPGP
jgi:hypothetical protein